MTCLLLLLSLSVSSEAFARASPASVVSSTPSAKPARTEGRTAATTALTDRGAFTGGIEGPAWGVDGALYVVNFARSGTVGRITLDGKGEVWVELPNGGVGSSIAISRDGRLFVADWKRHVIHVVDPATKQIRSHASDSRMHQPNDLALARDGTIYASDPDWKKRKSGRIWKVAPDGKVAVLLEGLKTPNGLDLSPDGSKLYFSDSTDQTISTVDLSGRGGAKDLKAERLIKFKKGSVDGLKVDARGVIHVARIEAGVVAAISPEGKQLGETKLLGRDPTNLAFGGDDGRSVFVTQKDGRLVETYRASEPGRSHRGP